MIEGESAPAGQLSRGAEKQVVLVGITDACVSYEAHVNAHVE